MAVQTTRADEIRAGFADLHAAELDVPPAADPAQETS